MKKTILAGAVALSLGAAATTASASTYTISVTQMVFGSVSAVTGTATNTEGTASGSFGGTFFYQPWTATVVAAFEGVGAHQFAGTDTQGTFDYNFNLSAGQVAFGLSFDWSVNLGIPVLAIFDCGAGTTGSTCTGTGGTGPNGGVPMQTNPFPGQDPAFNGFISAGSIDSTPEVPVPAAAWLLGSGLLGLVGVARRRKAA